MLLRVGVPIVLVDPQTLVVRAEKHRQRVNHVKPTFARGVSHLVVDALEGVENVQRGQMAVDEDDSADPTRIVDPCQAIELLRHVAPCRRVAEYS